MANPVPIGGDSYQHEKRFEAVISGTNAENTLTTYDKLHSIELLNKFSKAASLDSKDPGALSPEWKSVWQSEGKWLQRAATALANDSILQDKLGSGFDAVLKIAPIMKQKFSEKYLEKLIGDHAWSDADESRFDKKKSAFVSTTEAASESSSGS